MLPYLHSSSRVLLSLCHKLTSKKGKHNTRKEPLFPWIINKVPSVVCNILRKKEGEHSQNHTVWFFQFCLRSNFWKVALSQDFFYYCSEKLGSTSYSIFWLFESTSLLQNSITIVIAKLGKEQIFQIGKVCILYTMYFYD